MVLALPLHRDSFPEGYGWHHGGVFGRCGCRILLRFPIAEALKRLTGDNSGRVDLGGCPPKSPTDPGVHMTRTRFLIS